MATQEFSGSSPNKESDRAFTYWVYLLILATLQKEPDES
jgi:hypothetical protein